MILPLIRVILLCLLLYIASIIIIPSNLYSYFIPIIVFSSLSHSPPPNSFSPPSTSSPTMHPLLLRHNTELMRKTHICIHGGKKETGHVSIKMLMHMLSSQWGKKDTRQAGWPFHMSTSAKLVLGDKEKDKKDVVFFDAWNIYAKKCKEW